MIGFMIYLTTVYSKTIVSLMESSNFAPSFETYTSHGSSVAVSSTSESVFPSLNTFGLDAVGSTKATKASFGYRREIFFLLFPVFLTGYLDLLRDFSAIIKIL